MIPTKNEYSQNKWNKPIAKLKRQPLSSDLELAIKNFAIGDGYNEVKITFDSAVDLSRYRATDEKTTYGKGLSWLIVTGASNAGNNGRFTIKSVNDTTDEIVIINSNFVAETGSAAKCIAFDFIEMDIVSDYADGEGPIYTVDGKNIIGYQYKTAGEFHYCFNDKIRDYHGIQIVSLDNVVTWASLKCSIDGVHYDDFVDSGGTKIIDDDVIAADNSKIVFIRQVMPGLHIKITTSTVNAATEYYVNVI